MNRMLPYLNLGCGYHFHPDWTNIDFTSTGPDVIAYNLVNGIPFPDSSFEVVYHSNVLEHFKQQEAESFIAECYRVLKPGGVIRIAVPDLQNIVREYSIIMGKLEKDPGNEYLKSCYDWIMIEMYDQTVREKSGGAMLDFLCQDNLINKDYVIKRCGEEVKAIIDQHKTVQLHPQKKRKPGHLIRQLFSWGAWSPKLRVLFLKLLLGSDYENYQNGKFRRSGEIHFWVYDQLSLGQLLKSKGFESVQRVDAITSRIPDWVHFGLDTVGEFVRKPDSFFMEAVKR
jgi:SAM-dependent methyltransferase